MIHHLGVGTIGLGVLLAAGLIYHVTSDDSRANLTADTTLAKADFGCADIQIQIRQMNLGMADLDAWAKYMKPLLDVGVCRELEKGTRISVERRLPLKGKSDMGNWYCARPYGDPQCYWMSAWFVFGKAL